MQKLFGKLQNLDTLTIVAVSLVFARDADRQELRRGLSPTLGADWRADE